MIDKYAEIQNRIILYNACKGILRVKQAQMQKEAWINIATSALGAAGGGYLGQRWGKQFNDWLDKKYKNPQGWGAKLRRKLVRWGGGALGALGGGVAGFFVPPMAGKLGGALATAKGAIAASPTVQAVGSALAPLKPLAQATGTAFNFVQGANGIRMGVNTVADAGKSLVNAARKV